MSFYNPKTILQMKNYKFILYSLFLTFILSISAFAQDGNYNLNFGTNGVSHLNIKVDYVKDKVLLPDNKILMLAVNYSDKRPSNGSSDSIYFFIRVNENGILDNSFGENGIALIENVYNHEMVTKYTEFSVQSDGKIIVTKNKELKIRGENSVNIKVSCNLIRFNSNGSKDLSYGENGILNIYETTSTLRNRSSILFQKILNNDKMLVLTVSEEIYYILNLDSDGKIESTFVVDENIKIRGESKALLLDNDDNIFIVFSDYVNDNLKILKFSPNGVRDLRYGKNGMSTIYASGIMQAAKNNSIKMDSRNNILVMLEVYADEGKYSAIYRINERGKLDSSFGNRGRLSIQLSNYGIIGTNHGYDFVITPDKKIIWSGVQLKGVNLDSTVVILKYDNDGSRNHMFGDNGIVRISEFSTNKHVDHNPKNLNLFLKPNDHNISMTVSKNDTLHVVHLLNSRVYETKNVRGNVSGVWDADTIYVKGDITVPLNEELKIERGTYVYFKGEYKFDVFGTLTAKGSSTDNIHFYSDKIEEISSWPYYKNFWYGITFHSTEENGQVPSSLYYCNIKYALPTWLDEKSDRYGGGLVFYKSKVDVRHVTLTDCVDENIDGGVFSIINSNGNIKDISFQKTTTYSAGSLSLLNSNINIEDFNMHAGLGLYIDNSKVKLNRGIINNCPTYSQNGVVTSKNSEVEMNDFEISNNNGIGIKAEFSTFDINHTIIKDNAKDGGIFIESPSNFKNCEIIGNGVHGLRFQTIQNWGTVFTSHIDNSVIAKNGDTGIKFWSRNNAYITNCTIADNNSSSGFGGVSTAGEDSYLNNCIVYNNGSNLDHQASGNYTYSIIQGNFTGDDVSNTNMKNVDPLFRDAANGDYHLQSIACGSDTDSPAIDAGDPSINDLVLDCASGGLGISVSDIGAYGGEGNWWDKNIVPSCHYMGEVSGVWDCEKITIDGDIVIPEGDTLIISKNVDRVIISGPYQIKVEGVLLAIGEDRVGETKLDTDYIKFQGEKWKGIFFNNLNNSNVGTSIISNCRFDYADKMDMTYQGGGAIAIYNSDNVEITHSLFYANNARYGGAMYIEDSNPHIEDCYFELNGRDILPHGPALTSAGGALYIKTANPYLHKLQFYRNHSAIGGGAIVVDNSSISISNVLLAENETKGMGGAIEVLSNINGSQLKIVNMTSANNLSKVNGGGSIHTYGENSALEVINSIMYGNTKVELYVEGKEPVITYSILDSGTGESYFGTGCLDVNPVFINHYKLSSTECGGSANSPAIDAGHPDSLDFSLNCNEGLGTVRADMGYYGGRYNRDMPLYNENVFAIGAKDVLYQNYPNPFTLKTKIQFVLRSQDIVTLKVYNMLGEEIAILINEKLDSGLHIVDFDGTQLASGLYYYKLSTNHFDYVKKMILSK